jgi:hypothetical protein
MTAAAAALLAHITGTTEDSPEPGRNRLVASADHPGLAELVDAGLAESRGYWPIAQEYAWAATPAGLAAAREAVLAREEEYRRRVPLRKRQAKAVYAAWLDVVDACDVSFGEFLCSTYFAPHRAEARRGAR